MIGEIYPWRQFEYVTVLISIIVGLALLNYCGALAALRLTKTDPNRIGFISSGLFTYFFTSRCSGGGSFTCFLGMEPVALCIIGPVCDIALFRKPMFQPTNLEGISSFKEYYYEKHRVIYGTLSP